MSKYCFLCLSDEGVFLDITPKNYKSLCGEVETYLPVKIESTSRKQNKVCYKCAYELKQCSDFVKRYKESHTNLEGRVSRKQCCNICLETAKKGYIFKLDKKNDPLNNLPSKIGELFDKNLAKVSKSSLICLTCRYILDLLFDLTYLCQEMSKLKEKFNKDIDYTEIPKVNTAVIKRKTTNTSFMRIRTYVLSDSDSERNIREDQDKAEMNKDLEQKPRLCDQCHNSVQHGEDMYRFHRSRLTVCKPCWGSIGLSKQNKRKNKQNTKLCTVFLKDVFTDTALKKQNVYKVEKDSCGNQVYIITESESEVEVEDKVKVSKEPDKIQDTDKKRSTLRKKSGSSDNETKVKGKVKVEQDTSDSSKLRELRLRSSTKIIPTRSNHSDTDILPKQSLKSSKRRAVKRRNTSISSTSDDTETTHSKKKLKKILEDFKLLKDNNASDRTLISNDSIQENTNVNLRKRKTRSCSISTNGSDSSSGIKYSKSKKLITTSAKKSKLSKKEPLFDRTDVDETNTVAKKEYICNKCCVTHKDKLIAAMHELTHFKQLELKLHKINIPDKLKDEQQAEESSIKELVDELAEQQNEEITLSVNDDEDIDIADTTKEPDKAICPSSIENQEEDSLQMLIINKENKDESKVAETTTEPVPEEAIKTDKHEVKISETMAASKVTSVSMKNGDSHSENTEKDEIQSNSFNSDKIEKKQKEVDEATTDQDKKAENVNTGGVESEEIEANIEAMDVGKSKENENAESTENESIKLQQSNMEEIENHLINETGEDKITESGENKTESNKDKIQEKGKKIEEKINKIDDEDENKIGEEENKIDEEENKIDEEENKIDTKEEEIGETEEDKIDKIEATKGEEKEQNSNKNIQDDLKDLNANNAGLNNRTDIDETQNDNLSKKKQKIIEDDNGCNDKKETNIKVVDNIIAESSIENSVSPCNVESPKNNCPSSEEINVACTTHVEEKSKHVDDAKKLVNNIENANCSESTKNKGVDSINEIDQESTNTRTDNIFDLETDELDNCQNVVNHNKKYNEMEAETLEDISREIQQSADMPSLDPISSMEIDHNK